MRLRRARRAAAFMRSASLTVIAIGFSHNTWSPRFRAAMVTGACRWFGRAMLTPSRNSASNISSGSV